jgi:tellurite methyltransferase
VRRAIVGFHQDDDGDWVAELSCLHNQHVRHRPPFQDRPWVLVEAERAERVGMDLDCPGCDRAEMPEGLTLARVAGPFDADTLPAALRRRHRVADGTWACLNVLEGSVGFVLEGDPQLRIRLEPGGSQPIPPGVPHLLMLAGPVRLTIDFFVKGESR